MSTIEKRGLYFGWIIVAVNFLVMALVYIPSLSLVSLLLPQIGAEFQVPRAALVAIVTFRLVGSSVGALFMGKVLSKFSLRAIVPILLAIMTVGTFGMSFAGNVLWLYALAVFCGLAGSGASMIPISMLLNQWFGPKLRGKAVGISMVGSGFGSIVFAPIVGLILKYYTWRVGFKFFALLSFIAVPLTFFTYYRKPEDKGLVRIGDDPNAVAREIKGMSIGQALGSSLFWIAVLLNFFMAGVGQTWSSNAGLYLAGIGFDPVRMSGILSIIAIGTIVGKIALGAISDKWGTKISIATAAVTYIISYGMLSLISTPGIATIGATVIVGFSMAMSSVALPLVTGDLFGNREYGAIVGYNQIAQAVGASLVPILMASVTDGNGGDYRPVWVIAAIGAACIIAIVFVAYGMRKGVYEKLARKEASKTAQAE
jgi:MFS family permease